MFVYIWKDHSGTPFYVGLTKYIGRANPRKEGKRNWLTKQRVSEVGVANVVVEIRHVDSIEEGQQLEKELIAAIGRLHLGTGPLTNLRVGGEGTQSPTPEHREKLRRAMLNPDHPIRSAEARAKHRERMTSPDVTVLFSGDRNPAKTPEVRTKLKEKWRDPEYRARQIASRTGLKRHLSDATKHALRENLRQNPGMKGWAAFNGKDPEFEAKRLAGLRATQAQREEKMRNPEALAQRKARLSATMNSDAYKAKRAKIYTPEYRAKLSAAKKAYWEKKRSGTP
jgi:hypothetical protein